MSVRLFGMNRVWILVFLVLVFGMVNGEEMIPVVVLTSDGMTLVGPNDESGVRISSFSLASENVDIPKERIGYEYSSIDGFSATVTKEEFEALKKDSSKRVFVDDKVYHVTLDVSVPSINASDSWGLLSNNVNLTGAGQTVCIIDSGVNYSHPNLGGCYGNNNVSSNCKVIGGYDFVNGDSDPMDDEGHGTHVAGIISSNDSTYGGTAPDVKIIAIKSMDNAGDGIGVDISAGIDWCVANASKFNISVISMSLGDDSTYNTYCNANYFASFIDNAVAAGISVVVSAGNCDKVGQTNCTIGVAVPACVESATRVGSVDDSDVISRMRGDLFELLAPGVGIFSTVIGGGFGSKTGTSMSAPHVSGAIAIMKQYLNSSGQSKTPGEIDLTLNATGTLIDDTSGSGNNFSKIDVYAALFSLDVDSPDVTLVSPADNHVNVSANQSFTCNFTDWQLSNMTFRIWNSSGDLINESGASINGTSNETSFELISLSNDDYEWNCFGEDLLGNLAGASANFSLTVGEIQVELEFPTNESVTNVNATNFSCRALSASDYELTNVTFELWNSSGILIKNETSNLSGFDNTTIFNYTFENEGNYSWACVAYNNNSDEGNGVNFSVNYDASAPVISGLSVSVATSSATVSWNTDEGANSSVAASGGSWSNSSDYGLAHSILISSLSASTSYSYDVTSCDNAGNCANETGSFTTSAAAVVSSGGGGGGGGGGGSSIKIINIKTEDLWKGKSELVKAKDKISFDLTSGSHSLEIEEVGVDFAKVVVRSEPIYLTLKVGEKKKLNLSSGEYYDLIVGLNGIFNGKANISVVRIFEEIVFEVPGEDLNESEGDGADKIYHVTDEYGVGDFLNEDYVAIVVIILIVLYLCVPRGKKKKLKSKKSSKKKEGGNGALVAPLPKLKWQRKLRN